MLGNGVPAFVECSDAVGQRQGQGQIEVGVVLSGAGDLGELGFEGRQEIVPQRGGRKLGALAQQGELILAQPLGIQFHDDFDAFP